MTQPGGLCKVPRPRLSQSGHHLIDSKGMAALSFAWRQYEAKIPNKLYARTVKLRKMEVPWPSFGLYPIRQVRASHFRRCNPAGEPECERRNCDEDTWD